MQYIQLDGFHRIANFGNLYVANIVYYIICIVCMYVCVVQIELKMTLDQQVNTKHSQDQQLKSLSEMEKQLNKVVNVLCTVCGMDGLSVNFYVLDVCMYVCMYVCMFTFCIQSIWVHLLYSIM